MAKGDDNTFDFFGGGDYTPAYDAKMPNSVTGVDTSYLNGNKSATSATGPSDNGFINSDSGGNGSGVGPGGLGGQFDTGGVYSGGNVDGGDALTFSPSSPLTTFSGAGAPSAGVGAAGGAASAFTPTGGVDLAGGFPDPTSAAAGAAPADSFADRFQPANAAIANGTFDQQGAANGSGGIDLTQPQQPGLQPGGPNTSSPNIAQQAGVPAAPGLDTAVVAPTQGGAGGKSMSDAFNATVAAGSSDKGALPTAVTPTSGSTGGGGTFLDKLANGAKDQITKSPLSILASGGGLALNMLKGNKDPEGLAQVREAAASLKSTGSVLQTYLTTGTLPPGMQASVDLATKAAKARIIGNYASRGLSTDPTKNSALQQELSGVEQNAIVTAATLGDKLMTQGLSATGMAGKLYDSIMNLDVARSKATGTAISNFAAALAGGQTSSKAA